MLSFLIGVFGTFAFAAEQNVTNTNDSGPGSLRQAVADVGAAENVIFQPAVAGGTISLTSGELNVTKSMRFLNESGGGVTINGNEQCCTTVTDVGATTSFASGLTFNSTTAVAGRNVTALLVNPIHTIDGLGSNMAAYSLSDQGGGAYGIFAFKLLTIAGEGISGDIFTSSRLDAETGVAKSIGLCVYSHCYITGGISGSITAELLANSNTGVLTCSGIWTEGDLTVAGGLNGDVTALLVDTEIGPGRVCTGLDVGYFLTISDGISGNISAESTGQALGIHAGDITLTGGISGNISAVSRDRARGAFGLKLDGDISRDNHIDWVSGSITADGRDAYAIYAEKSLDGGDEDTPLAISGTIRAEASDEAVAIYTLSGRINVKLEQTGTLFAEGGNKSYAIRVFDNTQRDDKVELVAGCTVVGDIFLSQALNHDILILSGTTGTTTYAGNISNAAGHNLDVNITGGNWNLTGAISRAAELNITGGRTTLSGINTYNRGTTISDGTLIVNGQIVGNLLINGSGIVGGVGQVGNVINNGTLAPGNSIGTMTVAGNYTQNPGSTLEIEINDAGASDRLNITGDATINGGSVLVVTEPGTYTAGMTYRILEADSVTGAFDEVIDSLLFLKGELHYGLDYIDLLLVHSPYAAVAQTRNQFSTATYLDGLYDSASGDLSTVMGALDALGASDARAAFDHLSGEPYADLVAVNMNAANLFTDTAFYRLYNGADLNCANPPGRQFWTYSLGNWERQRPTGAGWDSSFGYANQLAGFMVGCDQQFDNVLLGFGGGYGQSNVGYISNPASDQTDLFNFSLYGKADFGAAYLAGVVGYTHGWNDMTRIIAIEGLDPRHATGSVDGNVFGMLLQAGYNLEHGWWRITPIIGLRYGHGGMSDATETGADSVNLAVGSTSRNSLVGHLGGRLAFCMMRKWRAEAYGQWEHEYSDTATDITMAFAGSPGEFTVHSALAERDAVRTGVVAIGQLNKRVSVHLNYDALLRASYASQQLTGGLSIGF